MSVASARAAAVPRPWVNRLLAAVPILSIYLWLCVLYGWEASGHVTIWLNSDELEMAQLSRAVAETGETARRGVPFPSHALYPYVLAPVWWIQDVGQAYGVAKLLNVLLMTSVVFPTYGLARMVVSKPWALFAAAGAGVIPALYYSSMLVEEPVAYPWATLCAYLIAKAFARRTRWWIGGAVLASLLAPLVREQLAVVPAAFLIAALALAATSPRAKREYARWSRWDWVGGVLLLVGLVIALNAAVSHVSFAWLVATQHYKDRMLENGLWAVGALAVGVGVLPDDRGPRRARPSARGGVDRRAARSRRDDGSADRRVRLVHGGEGCVHLDDVLDARRRTEPDLRGAAPLRRHRDVLRAPADALVGGRRAPPGSRCLRCCSPTSTRWTSASTRTRRASRCFRRRTGRTRGRRIALATC